MAKITDNFNCIFGHHESYSIAEDVNYNFSDWADQISTNTFEETVELFFELTALRCRHCKWIYTGL